MQKPGEQHIMYFQCISYSW